MDNSPQGIVLPGIVEEGFQNHWVDEMSDDAYHLDGSSVSSSGVKNALVSARQFYRFNILGKGKKETEALKIGKAAHCLLLEPEKFKSRYVVAPAFTGKTLDGQDSSRSKEAKIKKTEWMMSLPKDSIILSQEKFDQLRYMMDAVLEKELAVEMLKNASFERTGYFRDKTTGFKLRIRPDIFYDNGLAMPDLKTAVDPSKRAFANAMWYRGYYLSIMFYTYGIKEITGQKPQTPCFIVVQNCEPYHVCIYEIDGLVQDRGETAFRYGLDKIKASLESGQWPGLQTAHSEIISLPPHTDSIQLFEEGLTQVS